MTTYLIRRERSGVGIATALFLAALLGFVYGRWLGRTELTEAVRAQMQAGAQ